MKDGGRSFPRVIAPSILAADFARIGEEARRAEDAGADWLHLDIMDGNFVDNISFGPAMVEAVGRATRLPLDVHLMIDRPDRYLDRFLGPAHGVTVHVESSHDVGQTLGRIREAGKKAGLCLNPATPFLEVAPFLGGIDLLLVMTVEPGLGGQAFMGETMEKVRAAVAERDRAELSFHIEVDGGINGETAAVAAESGANVFVAGTHLFGAGDMAEAIRLLREIK